MSAILARARPRQMAAAKACFAAYRQYFHSPYPEFGDLPEDQQEKWILVANATTTRYSNFQRGDIA